MGDFIYLGVMILLLLVLSGFLLWRQMKLKNAQYEAALARVNVGAKTAVAAIDDAGRAISPEDLIRSFRIARLLEGWLTVALAGFGLALAVLLAIHATDHYGGDRLREVRGEMILLAAGTGIWLVLGALVLLAWRWAIWTAISVSGIFAIVSLVIVVNANGHRNAPVFPALCLLKVVPSVRLAQTTWRMSRAGIPLGMRL